jgi:membrane protein required for colicin V production
MLASFNSLDLVFVIFTLIFVATAFFRGFVKEIFSLFNWIFASIISYFFSPYISQFFLSFAKKQLIAEIVAMLVIFTVALIICGIATSSLCKSIKDKVPQYFDRSLGVFYGLVKTLLVFGIFYAVFLNALFSLNGKKIDANSEQFPAWLKQAKCYQILKLSGEAIDPLAKIFFDKTLQDFEKIIPQPQNELDKKIDEVADPKNTDETNEVKAEEDVGYNKKDIEKMNHLIEIIDK